MRAFFSDTSETAGSRTAKGSSAASWMGCSLCGLDRTCSSPRMAPYGEFAKQILVVGKMPGPEEDKVGRPFVGGSGRLAESLLREVGVDLFRDCLVTNAVLCFPGEGKDPTSIHYDACWQRLNETILTCKPKLIVMFGDDAIGAVHRNRAPEWTVGSLRGRLIPSRRYDCWTMGTFHPAAAQRMGERKYDITGIIVRHLDYALRHVSEFPRIPDVLEQPKYEDCTGDADRAVSALEYFSASKSPVVFDYETSGVNVFGECTLLSVALDNGERTVFIPVAHRDSMWKPAEYASIRLALEGFLRSDAPKVVHGIAFEEQVSRQLLGTEIRNVVADTMLAAHVLDQRPHSCSLEFLTYCCTGYRIKRGVDRGNLANCGLSALATYNASDAYHTRNLYGWQRAATTSELSRASDFFLRGQLALCGLEERGIKIDTAELDRQAKEVGRQIEVLYDDLVHSEVARGLPGFKPTSYNHLCSLLFGKLKLKPVLETGGGKSGRSKPSVSAKAIDKMLLETSLPEDVQNFLLILRKYNQLQKLMSTYIKGFRSLVHPDGLIHPRFHLWTTQSYRSSSDGPNFQNLPKHDPVCKKFRKVVVPHIGEWFVEVDFVGAEVCVIAMLTRDDELVRQVANDVDLHRYWAHRIFEAPEEEITREQRSRAKSGFVFPNFYGCQPQTCADYLRMPLDHIESVCKEFWAMYSGVLRWQRRLVSCYVRTGAVEMPYGFRRLGPMTRNEAINTPIQGTAFHLMLDGLIHADEFLRKHGFKSGVEIEVHDSVTVDVLDCEIEDVVDIMARELTQCRHKFQEGVPMKVEIEVGRNWHELESLGVRKGCCDDRIASEGAAHKA